MIEVSNSLGSSALAHDILRSAMIGQSLLAEAQAPLAVCSKQCIQRREWLLLSRTGGSFDVSSNNHDGFSWVFHVVGSFHGHRTAVKEVYIDVQRQPDEKLKAIWILESKSERTAP